MANKNDAVIRARYQSSAPTPGAGDAVEFQADADGNLKVTVAGGVTVSASDIEIGAVEIKDGATDTRAVVGANGLEVEVKAMPALPAGTNNIGNVDIESAPALLRTNDAVAAGLQTDAIMNGTTALTPKFASIVASTSGNTAVVAAVTSKKIRVLALCFTINGAVNVKWQSNTTDKTGLFYGDAAGKGKVLPFNPLGWFETVAGETLNINLSANIAVGGEIVYCEV